MWDIIIIGAGPAGLTAALYALRANKKVLLLEAKTYGGQIINANKIENYPGIEEMNGFTYATTLYNQVKKLGVVFKIETVIHIEDDKTVVTNKNTYSASSIILANGVENRKLHLEEEEKFLGRGISYCVTCDGNFYKNKVVAIQGGGNTALEDALYLSNIAKKVYLIHRRDTFRGEDKYVEELKQKENVEMLTNATVIALHGENFLESITIRVADEQKELKVDGLFVAIGQIPKNEAFKNVVDVNEFGYIQTKDGVHTKTDGIYTAGDTREKFLRQLTTAVSDGSIAAMMAIKEMK